MQQDSNERVSIKREDKWGLYAMLALSLGHLLVFAPYLFENTYFWDEIGWLTSWGPAPYTEVMQATLHEHWHPVVNIMAKFAFNLGGADSRPFSSINLIAGLGYLWGLFVLLKYFQAKWYLAIVCVALVSHNGILIPITPWPTCFLFMMVPLVPGIFAIHQLCNGLDRGGSGYIASCLLFTLAIYTGPCGVGFLPALIFLAATGRNWKPSIYILSIIGSCVLFLYLRSLLLVDLEDKVLAAANLLKFSPFDYLAVAGLDFSCVVIGWLVKLPAGYVISRVDLLLGDQIIYIVGVVVGVVPLGVVAALAVKKHRWGIDPFDWMQTHRPLILGALIFYSMNGLIYLGRLKAMQAGVIDLTRQDYYHIPTMGGIALMLFSAVQYLDNRMGNSPIWDKLKLTPVRVSVAVVGASFLAVYAGNQVYWKYASEENFFGPSLMATASDRRAFFQDLERLVKRITESDKVNTTQTSLPDLHTQDSNFTPRYYGLKISTRTIEQISSEGVSPAFLATLETLAGPEFPFEKTLFTAFNRLSQSPLTPRQQNLILQYGENRSVGYSGMPNIKLSEFARGLVPEHRVKFVAHTGEASALVIPQIAGAFYDKYYGVDLNPH